MDSNIDLIKTEDGSNTLYLKDLDETYHSIHGAIQESEHVFIKHGLEFYLNHNKPEHLNLLEFGFGTGLNALLTENIAKGRSVVSYTTLEKYPIEQSRAKQLNYGTSENQIKLFERMHASDWSSWQEVTNEFKLRKIEIDFREYKADRKFELIYFDAFSPSKQPDLWTKAIIQTCSDMLSPQGVFVTYSARGQLKRDLKECGFTVETLPGPPGKMQITRGIKGSA